MGNRGKLRAEMAGRRFLAVLAASAVAVVTVPTAAAAEDLNRSVLERLFGEPITTSATGKPQRASDVPVAMDIVTADQIRRSGAHDIPSVLARTTTLDVVENATGDYSVAVRGFATSDVARLLVLVDGRQVYLDDHGRTVWSAIPVQLSEIRQIEVVRGPNSALFGFNAAAGVINIVTYDPAYDRVTNLVVRGGTGGYGEVSAVATAPLPGNGGLRISLGSRREDPFSRGYQTFDSPPGPPHDQQVATRAEFGLAPGVRAGFDASYDQTTTADLNNTTIDREHLTVWSLRGHLTADTGYGLFDASIYHNSLLERLLLSPGWQQAVTVFSLSDTLKLGTSHILRPFLEYRVNDLHESDALNLNGLLNGRSVRVGYQLASAGGMWSWAIAHGLEWTAALRYDQLWLNGSGFDGPGQLFSDSEYNRRKLGTLAWNFGLVWAASPLDTIRLSAARGIQPPQLLDLGFIINSKIVGNTAGSPFAPTTMVDDYEMSYRRRLPEIATTLDLTAFYQVNHDLSSSLEGFPNVLPPVATVPTVVPESLGTTHSEGVEIAATTRIGEAVEIGLKYRGAFIDGALLPSNIAYEHASPRHIATAHVGFSRGPWEIDGFLRYASAAAGYRFIGTTPTLVNVRDYVTAAARVAYRITPHITAALEGEDLLAAHQVQSTGLEVERRVYLSLRADF